MTKLEHIKEAERLLLGYWHYYCANNRVLCFERDYLKRAEKHIELAKLL